MSTLTQFVGIGTSLTVTNLTACLKLTVCTATPLGSRPKGTGGFLIARGGSNLWIVAPKCTEVSRNWGSRNDASTLAETCTSFSGWFVPEISQLYNPGYLCRTYWDSFTPGRYWSNTLYFITYGCYFNFSTGVADRVCTFGTNCVRAFRCVTY